MTDNLVSVVMIVIDLEVFKNVVRIIRKVAKVFRDNSKRNLKVYKVEISRQKG